MICIVGLGYVGLPLAVALGRLEKTLGFDINEARVQELKKGIDSRKEVTGFSDADIEFSSDPNIISRADMIVVGVPTPIDTTQKPDLGPLISATKTIGKNMKKGSIVVYESTVYPGCTEDDCIPVLESVSGMECGKDFTVGYSPERINPGDAQHSLENVTKIISATDVKTLEKIEEMYKKIVKAELYRASSIKVAEAAKIIENTQRDINIALMNELKMIFDKMEINTKEVIEAAGTKWNFNKYFPGLVGGHCIGVDPYYLAYQANKFGHHPEMILAGRRINDDMAKYEAQRVVKDMAKKGIKLKGAKVLILGGTFKPNVADTRNSKVRLLVEELKSYGCKVFISEPWMKGDVFGCKNIEPVGFDGYIIKAVAHKKFDSVEADFVVMQ